MNQIEGPAGAPPIIFMHFGDSRYLRFTLDAARLFNRTSRVILLGDASNAHYARLGLEHHHLTDYTSSAVDQFHEVYEFIAGARENRKTLNQFFFLRYFYLSEFLRRESIDRLWTFDSDNLVLTDLSHLVNRFADYDCTEQCNGRCMAGLVNGQHVVHDYVAATLEALDDREFVAQQRRLVSRHPNLTLSDMPVFERYRSLASLRTIRLNTIIEGSTFDDAIRHAHGMEMKSRLNRVLGLGDISLTRKRLFFRDGALFTFHIPTRSFVRLNMLNMSWVRTSLTEDVYTYVRNHHLGERPRSIGAIRARRRAKNALPTTLRFPRRVILWLRDTYRRRQHRII